MNGGQVLRSVFQQAWIWDFFMSIHEEYLLFTKRGVSLSDIVYVFARYFFKDFPSFWSPSHTVERLASLSFIATCLVFQGEYALDPPPPVRWLLMSSDWVPLRTLQSRPSVTVTRLQRPSAGAVLSRSPLTPSFSSSVSARYSAHHG